MKWKLTLNVIHYKMREFASCFLFHCMHTQKTMYICNYTITIIWYFEFFIFLFSLKMIFMSLWIYEVRCSLFYSSLNLCSLNIVVFNLKSEYTGSHMHKMLIWNMKNKCQNRQQSPMIKCNCANWFASISSTGKQNTNNHRTPSQCIS